MTPGRLWKSLDHTALLKEPRLGSNNRICDIVPEDIFMFIDNVQGGSGIGVWFWKVLHGNGKVGYVYTLGLKLEDTLSDLTKEENGDK